MLNTGNYTSLPLTAGLVSQQHLTHGKIHKSTGETENGGTKSIFAPGRLTINYFFAYATESFELSTSLVKEYTQLSQHP